MIRLTALVENTAEKENLTAIHGLSVYIETEKHKILFDLGPNSTFEKNANRLGIDLKGIDTVIISHGHYDHGGGLSHFIDINKKAKIYIKPEAFGDYYNQTKYIGLDKSLKDCKRFVFTTDNFVIDDELTLFSGVKEEEGFRSCANDSLYMKTQDVLRGDTFEHEQYLIINGKNSQVLLTGCAHKGIVNILRRFEAEYKTFKKATVIGGFHFYIKSLDKSESPEKVTLTARELLKSDNDYYTCHCTGEAAYSILKEEMKERLCYFSTGKTIIFNKD